MKSWKNQSILIISSVLCLAGCGGGSIRLAKPDQAKLNHCYLVVRPDLANRMKLEGVQRARLGLYGNQLYELLTVHTSIKGAPVPSVSKEAQEKKTARALKIAGRIEGMLSPEQAGQFKQLSRKERLHPVTPAVLSGQYVLRYSLQGDEKKVSIKNASGKETKVVRIQKTHWKDWANYLQTTPDVLAALQSGEAEVQRAGILRAKELVPRSLSGKEREQLAEALLGLVKNSTAGLHQPETLKSFARFAGPEHLKTLRRMARNVDSKSKLAGLVAGIFTVSPTDAVEVASAYRDDFIRFQGALEGFEEHGIEAERALIKLDQRLQGKQRTWIQGSLENIGSRVKLGRRLSQR